MFLSIGFKAFILFLKYIQYNAIKILNKDLVKFVASEARSLAVNFYF